jgi:Arc/MetJ-type ribon-helix-helix transcriptional regulator
MEKYTFCLPKQQLATIREVSELTGLSVSELIRRALDALIKEYKLVAQIDLKRYIDDRQHFMNSNTL